MRRPIEGAIGLFESQLKVQLVQLMVNWVDWGLVLVNWLINWMMGEDRKSAIGL